MKYKILLVVLLVAILVGIIIAYSKTNNGNAQSEGENSGISFSSSNTRATKSESTKSKTLKSTSEVKSALVEQVEPHASYYLDEVCVELNQFVEKGSNILKYTNGEYLTAPYDCIITELNLPETDEKILNSHYVQISSNKVLAVTVQVDEKQIEKVSVGAEAKIKVSTLEKEYSGKVTNIASTANNGKFSVTIEFENDGDIKIGMTSNVEISI